MEIILKVNRTGWGRISNKYSAAAPKYSLFSEVKFYPRILQTSTPVLTEWMWAGKHWAEALEPDLGHGHGTEVVSAYKWNQRYAMEVKDVCISVSS